MKDDVLITIEDIRSSKMCSSGAREFCMKNNLNWNEFLEHGIYATQLSHIEDAMVDRVIEVARGRIKKANDRV